MKSHDCVSRCIIDRNHKWFIYTVFASADSGWALSVISSSNGNFSDSYVLSYGQVRLHLYAVDTQAFIGLFPRSYLRLLRSPPLYRQLISYIPLVLTCSALFEVFRHGAGLRWFSSSQGKNPIISSTIPFLSLLQPQLHVCHKKGASHFT